jgi:hypothetical protein
VIGCEPLQTDTEGAALTKSTTHVSGVEEHLGCEQRVCVECGSILLRNFCLGARTKGADLREQVKQSLAGSGISECTILGALGVSVSLYCICEIHFSFSFSFFILFYFESRKQGAF